MSSFSFSAPSPSSPHLRPRESSPVRNMTSSSPLQSPSRLVRRLSRSITMTPPSSSKSLRKSSEFYSECDRFIPSRAASNLEDAFERMDSNDPTSRQENQGVKPIEVWYTGWKRFISFEHNLLSTNHNLACWSHVYFWFTAIADILSLFLHFVLCTALPLVRNHELPPQQSKHDE